MLNTRAMATSTPTVRWYAIVQRLGEALGLVVAAARAGRAHVAAVALDLRVLERLAVDALASKTAVIEDVALQVAQTMSVNVTLQVGSVTDSIAVRADRGLLETADASLSQVIDDKRLLGLPLNGRNVMQLVSLSAGGDQRRPRQCHSTPGQLRPRILGRRQRDNTSVVLIDGMEISGQELNNYPLAIPPLDSLAEFRVQTANYSAEFGGNSGAVINVVSKRGSNEFHATLFEFLRDDALDARNPFSPTVDPLKRNQFGIVASGPVFLPGLYNGKNTLFWMFSYEGTRRRQAVTHHGSGADSEGARRRLQ